MFYTTLLLFFLFALTESKRHSSKKVTTFATDIECVDTPQCLSIVGNTWCLSGFTCIERRCHRILNTPCHSQIETCDDENQLCHVKQCLSSKDCDDGLFCNGHEKCVNGTCQIDPHSKAPCHKGICNETSRECIHPVKLAHWRNYAANDAFAASNGTIGVVSQSESSLWIGYTVGGVFVLILFSFIFLLIALIRRNDATR